MNHPLKTWVVACIGTYICIYMQSINAWRFSTLRTTCLSHKSYSNIYQVGNPSIHTVHSTSKKKRNYRQILHLGQEPSAKDTNFHILSDSLLAKHSVIIQIMVSFHSLMSDLLCFITELNNIANELARDP